MNICVLGTHSLASEGPKVGTHLPDASASRLGANELRDA